MSKTPQRKETAFTRKLEEKERHYRTDSNFKWYHMFNYDEKKVQMLRNMELKKAKEKEMEELKLLNRRQE